MLQATQLGKTFHGTPALVGLDLEVKAGEIVCLLGANGAGKTTTLQLFLGFLRPTTGSARVKGIDPCTSPAEARRLLAYLPENVALYPELSGVENLRYFAGLAGISLREDESEAALVRVGLPRDALRRQVAGYSKGMRQKVGIGLAIARRAEALLLDEPTSGLDPSASNEFSQRVSELAAGGVAILMVTHDLFRAKEVGARVGIMHAGRLLAMHDTSTLSHTELEQLYLSRVRAS